MKGRFFYPALVGFVLGFLAMFHLDQRPQFASLVFNHSKHQAVACEVCHTGVKTQARAVVPNVELCSRCHITSPDRSEKGLVIWKNVEKENPFFWPVSYSLPSDVHFSHQRHVLLGKIQCEACHGEIRKQSVPPEKPLKALRMEQCLECHRQKKVIDDCAQCHK